MIVFAFDRDWTVDVNPHPAEDRPAVPLSWVRHLAHQTAHEVWATGNQQLKAEAEIPGVIELGAAYHEDHNPLVDDDGNPQKHQWPTRRERLRWLASLYPDAEQYIVVDDLDLSDLDRWTHFHSWEFVPAVRTGEIDIPVPSD